MRPHQWMASMDLKDAYFHMRMVATPPPVPPILLAGHKLPIRNPSVRPVIRPPSLHKDSSPSHNVVETPRNPTLHLP